MAVFGVIRVGFQDNPNANNKSRYALTGTLVAGDPESPFRRRNTGVFTAEGVDNAAAAGALARLAKVLIQEAASIDIISISLTRTDAPAADVIPADAVAAVKQAVDA